ncbi:MAG: nucleotidyltransferase family protein [Planctomycetaceae bacterium]
MIAPVVENNLPTIADLCGKHHVRRLELFGSAAREDYDPARSDLDFLVDFLPLQSGQHADAYFGLLEDLQHLFGRPVDLVMSRAIRNRYLRESIDESRTVVYAA